MEYEETKPKKHITVTHESSELPILVEHDFEVPTSPEEKRDNLISEHRAELKRLKDEYKQARKHQKLLIKRAKLEYKLAQFN